jgi:hypothetical protein
MNVVLYLFTLKQPMKAQRGSRVVAVLGIKHLRWMVVNGKFHSRRLYARERYPVPINYEAGRAPGPVWMGAENLTCTRIRSPDRPSRSRSLYRLSYRGPHYEPANFLLIESTCRCSYGMYKTKCLLFSSF